RQREPASADHGRPDDCDRRHRRSAVALLFVLSQTAWTSAQEPTSTDVSHHAGVQTTDAELAPQEGSQRIDSDQIRPQLHDTDVRWGRIIRQTLSFQVIQHTFVLAESQNARGALRGPWVRDWFQSAASPFVEPHWSDGGRFFVNYVAHPMAGSVYGY